MLQSIHAAGTALFNQWYCDNIHLWASFPEPEKMQSPVASAEPYANELHLTSDR